MILQDTYTLSNGVNIPKIGLGTWMIDDEKVAQVVQTAVEVGYRHIDTAQAYQNEKGVGEGIKNSNLNRDDLFITTKLAAEIKDYNTAVAAIDESLNKMELDYIDLMIIHSPKPWDKFGGENRFFNGNKEVWKALEQAYKENKVKSIGVSNFKKEDIENILEDCSVEPMVNQILAHISNTPFELISYCQNKNMLVEAYSPIGHGELMKNENIKKIADKYNVSIPQLSIRYCLELGLLPLPKSSNPDHINSNSDVDFRISEEDMMTLKNMKQIEDYGNASVFPVFN